jgi:hypothetical protein
MKMRNFDVVMVMGAAPIAVLAGVPATGYGIGAVTWILLRGFGGAVDRRALAGGDLGQLVALRIAYRLIRVALLVLAVVVAEQAVGKPNGLAALAVIVSAFTVQLVWSIAGHERAQRPAPGVTERATDR